MRFIALLYNLKPKRKTSCGDSMNQEGRILTSTALKVAGGLGFGTVAAGAVAAGLYFATRLHR
jgi:hypothetical protein